MYFEGISVPQRLVFDNISATTGDAHTLTFNHQANKGGIHAYDFLTSWEQAVAAANATDPPPPGLLTNGASPAQDFYNDDGCDAEIGPPGTLAATCSSLRSCVPTVTCSTTTPFACGAGTDNCVKVEWHCRLFSKCLRRFVTFFPEKFSTGLGSWLGE